MKKRQANAEELAVDDQNEKEARAELQQAAELERKEAVSPEHAGDGWAGQVTTDEILVLLIEFPDYESGNITAEDNPVLLYDNYPKEHYENMVFGDKSYIGPDGQELISMKEFYEQQSGGSYTIDGAVSDWYVAEQPAAYYGANDAGGNDIRPRELVKEALVHAAQDPNIDLSEFDKEDIMDLDGDGNYREPDGIIDHLMIVHAGTGEEAGGGSVGADAIWSHSWSLEEAPFVIPNTQGLADIGYWGDDTDGDGKADTASLAAFDYTIQPEDGATGVFAHEYGHDLGLPDEYDSIYSGLGAPTGYWTLMASGSWAGEIHGTEPTGFSPDNKLDLQKRIPGSNWFEPVEFNLEDLQGTSKTIVLDQASIKSTNSDAVKINLPDKETVVTQPTSGTYQYFGGNSNNAKTTLSTTVDLTNATTSEFTFNANYEIEEHWDYAAVEVNDGSGWITIPGNITTVESPNGQNPGNGITGSSNGWFEASFDLSSFAGKEIELAIVYYTDPYVSMAGLYVDDLAVTIDGEAVITDDAESENDAFVKNGFTKSDGIVTTPHYYLVEWRNWTAADKALGTTTRGDGTVLTHDPGMVVWYVDDYYTDNWTGDHPGDGFVGVVDAHQEAMVWSDGAVAGSQYQIQDAAFSLSATDETYLDYSAQGYDLSLAGQPAVATFDDSRDYSNPGAPDAGRNVPKYGLKIHVVEQADDMSTGTIVLHVGDENTVELNDLENNVYSSKEGFNEVHVTGHVHKDGSGEALTVTYEIWNSKGEIIETSTETLLGLVQSLDKTFTITDEFVSGDYTLNVSVKGESGTVSSSALAFSVDHEPPVVVVDTGNDNEGNDNETAAATKAVSLTVSIEEADPNTLEYLWSQSPNPLNDSSLTRLKASSISEWKSFNNGDTLTLKGVEGTWYLHVRAKDFVGNPIEFTSDPYTLDNTAPIIELTGDNPFIVKVGNAYKEPGYTATDNLDGNLTNNVVMVSNVDTNKVGQYNVTYSVSDAAGNKAEITRTIKVVEESVLEEDENSTDGQQDDGDSTTDSGNESETGGNLPNTATNAYNWIIFGALILVLGAALMVIQRRGTVTTSKH
ncbi:immune inhibitor A domain-containing protein [Salirhabdus sp. Marseille-P4669]|uniref:immune inhibitor A domain-containing protein n=1 Tax=Salirhabdus sp. Marseille-P4669 TaxID=2042310 RepID=UPI0011AF4DE7|nr:immune inhibitor A domain-containing protein [Salirhabdus sp. Marseille-P4669]